MVVYWLLTFGIAVAGVLVLIGWLRHRNRKDYRDIRQTEISDDFVAQEELLEDALTERDRASQPRDPSGGL